MWFKNTWERIENTENCSGGSMNKKKKAFDTIQVEVEASLYDFFHQKFFPLFLKLAQKLIFVFISILKKKKKNRKHIPKHILEMFM